ncbi:hypothetical protein [Evansella clarkii]|jgi:hypothetical protein|uniref:hypothetical protein n=1 Tax=Evansella clarkii TaxID=79879 RepID=UPI000996B530|nr:hypothetical protein [Evansella clarkii]
MDHELDKDEKYSDFITVEKNRKQLIPEQSPEGPYGSPIEGTLKKTTPWEEGQQAASAFVYENRNYHQNAPRKEAGAHPTHADKRVDKSNPY